MSVREQGTPQVLEGGCCSSFYEEHTNQEAAKCCHTNKIPVGETGGKTRFRESAMSQLGGVAAQAAAAGPARRVLGTH
jgi:hypothetical protein